MKSWDSNNLDLAVCLFGYVKTTINEQIAKPLGKTLEEASQGIFDVALANMVRAIRVSSVERGLDPRDFALIAFGGGGAVFTADVAEELQIARDLFLLEYTGGKLHFPTISTAKSVDLIRDAKKNGLQVSCSVAAHHLTLTDEELHEFNGNYKTNPPLRTSADCKALLKGIKTGVIDIITSDHDPIDIEHKKVEFSEAKDGTIGLESFFGAVNSILTLEDFIESITSKPRQIFGLAQASIAEGKTVDISLFNPDEKYIFTKEHILSTSKNSAFLNKKMNGKVYGIFSNNQLILNS